MSEKTVTVMLMTNDGWTEKYDVPANDKARIHELENKPFEPGSDYSMATVQEVR